MLPKQCFGTKACQNGYAARIMLLDVSQTLSPTMFLPPSSFHCPQSIGKASKAGQQPTRKGKPQKNTTLLSKAKPEQSEKSKTTTSRDYAIMITWVQLQYCIFAQTIRN